MIKLVTEHPVAIESPDHISTLGPDPTGGPTKDNSKNHLFNQKLYKLFTHKIAVLDLGCSGGGFIEDCINDGHLAVGLEGSDYSLKNKRAAWSTIPNHLFTCDCTKPFEIQRIIDNSEPIIINFNVVTAWEFMEHIAEKDLHPLITNVLKHIHKDGYWIMSVSRSYGPPFHQTIQPQYWWERLFEERGLINKPQLVQYFHPDWIRNCDESFHLVLQKV